LDDEGVSSSPGGFGRTPEELYDAIVWRPEHRRIVNSLLEEKENNDILVVVPPTSEIVPGEAVTVLGLKGLLTAMAKCCNPTW